MSAFKDLAKGGWHPGGKKESTPSYSSSTSDSGWRSKFKGADTVAGWVGKPGRDNYRDRYENHQSTPLGALKDPDTFGPPPKHYGGSGGGSDQVEAGLGSSSVRPRAPPPPARPKPGSMRAQAEAELAAQEEPPMRRGPFQVNTTGLDTANLPAPPVRRSDYASSVPAAPPAPVPSTAPRAPPKLPPRLPPRQAVPTDAPPSYSAATDQEQSPAAKTAGLLNTAAIGRLGKAGVSVPGFGIGQDRASPPIPARAGPTSLSQSTSSTTSEQTAQASPGGGTTWAQKRAALETAQKMREDPSKVSFAELKSSAMTANNFRERHGEQVASGLKYANKLNSQYGGGAQAGEAANSTDGSVSLPFRKPAVPLPSGSKGPPPIPHGSKPSFS